MRVLCFHPETIGVRLPRHLAHRHRHEHLPVDWCKVQGKTVLLHLPDVGLLDGDFINDTRTTVFVQEGNWNADAKQQLRTQTAAEHEAARTQCRES